MGKRTIQLFFLSLLLSALLFCAGCLTPEQEMQMRFDCLDLASGSFALVPECDSQETCYKKVGNGLFGFDDSPLGFESRRVLESYKNSLALSWRFFNESQAELKKIRELCWNREQWSELPVHVNRFNQLIIGSFAAADAANQQAVLFLVSEKEWLASQELDLVREEPLFADWVLLQDNLNELQTKKTGGVSLAAKMLETQERMDAVFSQYGFGKRFVSSEQLADLLPEHRQGILENLPQQEPIVPIFAGIVIDFAGWFSNQQRLQESVQTLKKFPAFAFFSVYRELAGSSDSVAAETAVLAKNLALHHQQTEQKAMEWQEKLAERLEQDGKKIADLQLGSLNGLPEETLQELAKALQMQARVSLKNFEISDWQETQPKMEQKLLEIRQDFLKTVESAALSRDSIGMRLQSLQQTENRLTEWEANLSFLENELRGSLLEACNERVRQIREQSKTEFSETIALELNAQMRFFAEEFGKNHPPIQRLSLCSQSIQASEKLSLFLQDQKAFEAESEATIGNCFSFLETAFNNQNVSLKELEWQWEQLQENRRNPSASVQGLETDCQNLRQKTEQALEGNEKIVRLEKNFLETERYWNAVLQLNWNNQSFSTAEKKVMEQRGFFSAGQLRTEKALPVLETRLEQSEKLAEELRGLFKEQLQSFLEKTVRMTSFSAEIPEANQPSLLSTQLVFSNPTLINWEEPLAVALPGKWSTVTVSEANPAISSVFVQDQKLRTLFSRVPSGISACTIRTEQTVSTLEKNEFLFANQFKALLQKTIRFGTDSVFPELRVSTLLMTADTTNVWVIEKNQEKPFSRNGQEITFMLQNVSDKSTASVFFTVPNPMQTAETLGQNGNELHWSIEIQNRLNEAIPKPQIVLLLPASAVSAFEAMEEGGKKLAVQQTENEARIELSELQPHETKQIRVTARIGNQEELLEQVASKAQGALEELIGNGNESIQQEAQRILAELLGEKKSLETVFSLAERTKELQEKAARYRLDSEQFQETLSSTEHKIAQFRELASQLKQRGYAEIGLELEQRIQQSQALLEEARAGSEKDASLAATLALRAMAGLEEGNTKNRASFEQKQKETNAKAEEILALFLELLPSDSRAAEQQQKMETALLELEKSAWDSNPGEFLDRLQETSSVLAEAEKTLNALLEKKANTVMEGIGKLRSLVSKDGLEKKNHAMLEWLLSHPESEAIQAGILLPFRKTDLEKRQQEITGLLSQKLDNALTEFETLFRQKEFAKALQSFAKNKADFDESLQKAESLQQAIESDWQAMRQKAGIALEKAQSLASQGKLDSKQAASLVKARKAFEEEQFLETLLAAESLAENTDNHATGFTVFGEVPPVIIPLLIAGIALAFYRFRKKGKKEQETQKTKIERVPNEW